MTSHTLKDTVAVVAGPQARWATSRSSWMRPALRCAAWRRATRTQASKMKRPEAIEETAELVR
jgi:hypothetical protein